MKHVRKGGGRVRKGWLPPSPSSTGLAGSPAHGPAAIQPVQLARLFIFEGWLPPPPLYSGPAVDSPACLWWLFLHLIFNTSLSYLWSVHTLYRSQNFENWVNLEIRQEDFTHEKTPSFKTCDAVLFFVVVCYYLHTVYLPPSLRGTGSKDCRILIIRGTSTALVFKELQGNKLSLTWGWAEVLLFNYLKSRTDLSFSLAP